MSILSQGDWSPLANAISSFGTGLAGNALKKAEMQRQLGKDIVDYDRAQVAMDASRAAAALNRAKTESEAWSLDQRRQLAGNFDPTKLTADERLATSLGAILGSKSVQDVLKGAGTRGETRMRTELYGSDDPVEKLAGATGRVVMPYSINPQTGTVFNRLTGQVDLNDVLAKAAASARDAGLMADHRPGVAGSASGGGGKMSQAIDVVRKLAGTQERDDFGVARTVTDPEVIRKLVQGAIADGVNIADPEAMARYASAHVGGILGAPAGSATTPVPAAATPADEGGNWLSDFISGLFSGKETPGAQPAPEAPQPPARPASSPGGYFRNRADLMQALRTGHISQEEFEDLIDQFGE